MENEENRSSLIMLIDPSDDKTMYMQADGVIKLVEECISEDITLEELKTLLEDHCSNFSDCILGISVEGVDYNKLEGE